MEKSEYLNIFQLEATHPFYLVNHQLVIGLLKRYGQSTTCTPKILDAGCGTGLLAKKLTRFGHVTGLDISPVALKLARQRGIKTEQGSITKLPFAKETFDVVICVDVLYHRAVKNDRMALQEFHRVLKPGGLLVLRVPAHKWLTSNHDHHVHTRQRYEKKELAQKLKQTKFQVVRLSYINVLFFFLALLKFGWEKLVKPQSTHSTITPLPVVVRWLVTVISQWELEQIEARDLPIGQGLVAVCRKVRSELY